jgi:hypothetical protein
VKEVLQNDYPALPSAYPRGGIRRLIQISHGRIDRNHNQCIIPC